jgi:hypothetical protein
MGRIGGMVRRMKAKKRNHGRKTAAVIISAVLLQMITERSKS